MATKKEKNNNQHATNHKKTKNGILPVKEFIPRNSLLTDLFEMEHFKSIHRMSVAVLFIIMLNNAVIDTLSGESIGHSYRYIGIGFGRFHIAIMFWLIMFSAVLILHPIFYVWAKVRISFSPKSVILKLWDYLFLSMFLIYYGFFLYLPPHYKDFNLPIATTAVILAEQIRFLMKMHAFVRSNASKILNYKIHSDKKSPLPTFWNLFYFLFVPTLVYRDEYPRTKKIRWWFVAMNLIEFTGVIILYSLLTSNYLVSEYKNYGLIHHNWRTVTMSVFRTILPASVIFISGFYMVLHTWMNTWAELTRFADRLFYTDWWNAETYSAYYRKWNCVVHDFLHAYIYRDVYEATLSKFAATTAVFITSALVHEYIIGFMLGFCYPILFIQFLGFGYVLVFIKVKGKPYIGNTFLWWSLATGFGMQISMYTMEWFARLNCPKDNETYGDFFIPRSWNCNVPENVTL